MSSTIALAIFLTLAGCVAPRPRPEPMVIAAGAGPPPPVVEVAPGLYCEHGYLLQPGRCVSFLDLATGPVPEIELPPSWRGTMCMSGGCSFSYVAPSYWGLSIPAYGYGWPYGFGWPYAYGWPYGYGRPYGYTYSWYGSGLRFPSYRFRAHRPFERRFPPGGFHRTPHHGHRFSGRRSTSGRFFGGKSHGGAHPHGGSGGWRR